jgi:hypothetical protein
MTSGFLGYTYSRKTCDEDDVIFHLEECAMLSMHPMLLPAVILKLWCNYYHEKLDKSRWMLRRVEEQNRKLEEKYSADQNSEVESDGILEHADRGSCVPLEHADQGSDSQPENTDQEDEVSLEHVDQEGGGQLEDTDQEDEVPLEHADQEGNGQPEATDQEGKVIKLRYHENHEIIDREYKFLWSENFHFVKDLSTSCLQALDIIRSFQEETRKDVRRVLVDDEWIEREINGHLLHLDGTVNAYEQRRERMLKRMEVTFDEVC